MNSKYFNSSCKIVLLLMIPLFSLTVSAECAYNYRYQDNGDGTATNLQRDLMWQRCSLGQAFVSGFSCNVIGQTQYSWDEALQQAEALNASGGYAGYTDWRVPNRNELASLTEGDCFNDVIFRSALPGLYWSSSPVMNISSIGITGFTRAWYGAGHHERTARLHVRLVRTANLVP